MILGRGGGGPLEDENQTLGGQKSSDIIYGWSPRWFHHTFFSSVLFSTGNYMPIYIRQFLKFDILTIIFLSLSVFPRISVSGSVGFWYHGNGREARHLFCDFEQKSDSCNIAGLGCEPDRVPSPVDVTAVGFLFKVAKKMSCFSPIPMLPKSKTSWDGVSGETMWNYN